MTVASIINYAKYSELSQLGVVKNLKSTRAAEVQEAEKQILSYINLGLIELYKRFTMRSEEEIVAMVEGQSLYTLTDPLLNKVYEVYDENGKPYPLNDETNVNSINTPSYNVIQIPTISLGNSVFVIYNSAPDELLWNADLTTVDIPIPPIMLEAMLHYVGYRGHGATDGNVDAENNTHYMRFDKSCRKLVEEGAVSSDEIIMSKSLEDKGFE